MRQWTRPRSCHLVADKHKNTRLSIAKLIQLLLRQSDRMEMNFGKISEAKQSVPRKCSAVFFRN